jgi:hypothetical protein
MGEQQVKIKVTPKGKVTIEAVGFNGVGCKDATKAFETAIMGKSATEYKPEYTPDVEQQGGNPAVN